MATSDKPMLWLTVVQYDLADLDRQILRLSWRHSTVALAWQTFPILCQTASWTGDRFVVTPSTIGQPTWPTQPSIPLRSVNEQ